MGHVSRTIVAFAAVVRLAIAAVAIGKALEVGSWGYTALATVAGLVITLDRRRGVLRRHPRAPQARRLALGAGADPRLGRS
jgi:hypothetical protein